MTSPDISLPVALARFIADHEPRPFCWQTWNCCHWAGAWCAVATGTNPMDTIRAPSSAADAFRLLRRMGGTLRSAVTRQIGREPIPAADADLGDLVLVPVNGAGIGGAMGICAGEHVVMIGDGGELLSVPLRLGQCAWRVSACC